MSEKDVEHLIETFQHDEEFQPSRYNLKRVHPDEYRQRRDTHAPYRPGYGGGKRHYSERFVQCREYWGEEVDYFDDRYVGAGDTKRFYGLPSVLRNVSMLARYS